MFLVTCIDLEKLEVILWKELQIHKFFQWILQKELRISTSIIKKNQKKNPKRFKPTNSLNTAKGITLSISILKNPNNIEKRETQKTKDSEKNQQQPKRKNTKNKTHRKNLDFKKSWLILKKKKKKTQKSKWNKLWLL